MSMVSKMLKEANGAYPDDMIENYFDLKTGKERKGARGDTLALFIAREISELTEEDATVKDNCIAIQEALTTAMHELGVVIQHFAGLERGKSC